MKQRLALDAGTAIVLVTHDTEQAGRMGTRHVQLHEGLVEEVARPVTI